MNSHQGIKIVLHMYISATQCRETNRAINVIIILNLKSQSTEVSTSTAATPQTFPIQIGRLTSAVDYT